MRGFYSSTVRGLMPSRAAISLVERLFEEVYRLGVERGARGGDVAVR
jgi:hypothetical protein